MGEMGGSGSAEVEWHPDVFARFYPCVGLIVLCERSGGVWERAKVLKAPKDVRVLHLFCWLMVMVILPPRLAWLSFIVTLFLRAPQEIAAWTVGDEGGEWTEVVNVAKLRPLQPHRSVDAGVTTSSRATASGMAAAAEDAGRWTLTLQPGGTGRYSLSVNPPGSGSAGSEPSPTPVPVEHIVKEKEEKRIKQLVESTAQLEDSRIAQLVAEQEQAEQEQERRRLSRLAKLPSASSQQQPPRPPAQAGARPAEALPPAIDYVAWETQPR